ncbi:hypothetical protein PP707_07615, partial [Acetobacter pasteurianus]|nr:hypothetical protein [Acetobacter pasteurianus]
MTISGASSTLANAIRDKSSIMILLPRSVRSSINFVLKLSISAFKSDNDDDVYGFDYCVYVDIN